MFTLCQLSILRRASFVWHAQAHRISERAHAIVKSKQKVKKTTSVKSQEMWRWFYLKPIIVATILYTFDPHMLADGVYNVLRIHMDFVRSYSGKALTFYYLKLQFKQQGASVDSLKNHQEHFLLYKKKAGDEDPDLFEEAAKSWETVVEAAEYAETGLNVLIWAMLHWLGSLLTFCASFAFSILGLFKLVRRRFYIGVSFLVWMVTTCYFLLNFGREIESIGGKEGGKIIERQIYLPCNIEVEEVEGSPPFFLIHWYFQAFYLTLWLYMACEALIEATRSKKVRNHKYEMMKARKKFVLDPEKLFNYCNEGEKAKMKDIIRKHGQSIDINATKNGRTLLHIAAQGGHQEILQTLIKRYKDKIDGSIRNNNGDTVLDVAIQRKNADIINLILEICKPDMRSLILAVKNDQEKIIRRICCQIQERIEQDSDIERLCLLLEEVKNKTTKKARRDQIKRNIQIHKQVILEGLEKSKVKSEDKKANIRLEFECPICCDEINPPLQIFACSNDHFLCSECLGNSGIQSCPICREDFSQHKPTRRRAAERLRQSLQL